MYIQLSMTIIKHDMTPDGKAIVS